MEIIRGKYYGTDDAIHFILYYSEEGTVKKTKGNPWSNIFKMLENENYAPCRIQATLNNFFIKYPEWIPSYVKYITIEGIKVNKKICNELDKIYNNAEKKPINEMKQQMFYTVGIVVENVIKSNFTEEYNEFFSKPGLKNSICNEVLKKLGYSFIDTKKKKSNQKTK